MNNNTYIVIISKKRYSLNIQQPYILEEIMLCLGCLCSWAGLQFWGVISSWNHNFHACVKTSLLPIKDYKKKNFFFIYLSFLYFYFHPSFIPCYLPVPFTCQSYITPHPFPFFLPSSFSYHVKTSVLSFLFISVLLSYPFFLPPAFPSFSFVDTNVFL